MFAKELGFEAGRLDLSKVVWSTETPKITLTLRKSNRFGWNFSNAQRVYKGGDRKIRGIALPVQP